MFPVPSAHPYTVSRMHPLVDVVTLWPILGVAAFVFLAGTISFSGTEWMVSWRSAPPRKPEESTPHTLLVNI